MEKLTFNLEIYTYQIDFAHHVSNIVYIQWMEIGRLKLLEFIGLPIEELEKRDMTPILVRTEIDYKKALYINNKVKVEVYISKLNNASAIINFNFYNEQNELVAKGIQKGLFIKLSTKKPARIGDFERSAFEKVLAE